MYLIPLLFRAAESLASMLLPPPCPVQFPGDPHSTGLAWVERSQSGASREQTRVSLTASLLHLHSAEYTGTNSAPLHLAYLPLSGAHSVVLMCVHAYMETQASFPSLTNSRYMSYLFHLSFQPVRSVTDPGWRQSTVEL